MPQYGEQDYWNERYDAARDNPFDWLCDFEQLEPTLEPLISRDKLVLIVGCGDAPFSPDLYYKGGWKRLINIDYSDVVVARQKKRYPEMDWREMDALNMDFNDNTFDAIIDKSLIDTTMCYKDGHETTLKLFAELQRVLKPGGRLITISLHSEDEVVRYRFSPAVSHCRLENRRKKAEERNNERTYYHTFAVFDKLEGTAIDEKISILDQHPIEIVNAVPFGWEEDRTVLEATEDHSWNPKEEPLESAKNIQDLMATVDRVLEDLMELHSKAKALAKQRAEEENSQTSNSSDVL